MKKPKVSVTKIITFDSAHNLIDYNGPCRNLHGHTYKLEVTIKGEIREDGMVIDFNILKEILNKNIIETLDHRYLNEVMSENPTCENTIVWIWNKLENEMKKLKVELDKIVLWETPNSFATLVRSDMEE